MIKQFVQAGIDPTSLDQNGGSVLFHYTRRFNFEVSVMKMLIEMNAGDPTLALNKFLGHFELPKSKIPSAFYQRMIENTCHAKVDRRKDKLLIEKFI
jgi:hypothetical protein